MASETATSSGTTPIGVTPQNPPSKPPRKPRRPPEREDRHGGEEIAVAGGALALVALGLWKLGLFSGSSSPTSTPPVCPTVGTIVQGTPSGTLYLATATGLREISPAVIASCGYDTSGATTVADATLVQCVIGSAVGGSADTDCPPGPLVPVAAAPPPAPVALPPTWAQQLAALGTPVQQGAAMAFWVMLGRFPAAPVTSLFNIPLDTDHVNPGGAALYMASAIAQESEWQTAVFPAFLASSFWSANAAAADAAAGAAPGLTAADVEGIQFAWRVMLGRWATPIGAASTESWLTGYVDQGGTCPTYTSIPAAGIQDVCLDGRTQPGLAGIGTNLAYSTEFINDMNAAVAAQAPPSWAIVNTFYGPNS